VSDAARTPSIATKQPMKTTGAAQPVVLPERRSADLSDEVIRVPKTEKMEVPEPGSKAQPGESAAVGDRENRREIGDRERLTPGSTTGGGSGGTSPLSSTGVGVATDRGVSYSVQWLDGGSRHKISGELPRYPEGVNVEAQIKILTVVLPDGTVKDVSPAQKANTKLEEAAMKEVRLWRFEPLRSNLPQLEQHAVITFLFTLK
jgi:TonB family protein